MYIASISILIFFNCDEIYQNFDLAVQAWYSKCLLWFFSDTWAHSFCNIWFRIQLNWFEFTRHVFHLFMQLTKQQLNGYDWQRGGKMASRSSCRPRHRTVITLNGESISKLLNILKAYRVDWFHQRCRTEDEIR